MPDSLTDGVIYVAYSHMDNAADDMVQQTRAIPNTLSSLEAERGALKVSWVGADAEVYTQKQSAWDQAVQNMEQVLSARHAADGHLRQLPVQRELALPDVVRGHHRSLKS